ncbi:MAG: hypothetical protein MJ121_02205 [Clostridia bacterium]|nr:hypothetical protein [Clostridia bacterium]
MTLEKLIALISDAFGMDANDISGSTTLDSIVSDEFEMQELISSIEEEFEVELSDTPSDDWTVDELAEAVSASY